MTGEPVWEGRDGDVDAAVATARRAATGWALRPLADRRAIAERFAAIVSADAEAFATLIAREVGKPLWEARTEVASVAAKVAISIAAQDERAGERVTEDGGLRQALRHRPHGVLAVLGPYNFPAHLPNGHIVPALLAGNTVVFKPSELAPAVGLAMARYWDEAGLPEGVLTVIPGRADTGRALAAHDGIDGLLFTGSAATGAALNRQFAETPHRLLAVEAGGNAPLIAWDVTDHDAAASLIVNSAFLSAGQRCTCARRLILAEDDAATLDAVLALSDRLIVGGPFDDPEPFMGPVVDLTAARRVMAAYDALVAAGGRVLRPLRWLQEGTPLLSPAIVDVTGCTVPDEEIFGPVLQVRRVPDFDAAMAAANDTRFGLAAGLIGGDDALYARFWSGVRAGVVNWNRPTTGASSAAPFGGVGISGNHRPSAYYAADYAAYPVAGLEADQPSAIATKGLRAAG